MSWQRACRNVSLLHIKKREREGDEIVVKERSLLQRGVSVVQGYFAGDNADTLTPFWNEVGEQACEIF